MGEITAIEWCDHTFNPWIGCTKVSPACDNGQRKFWDRLGLGDDIADFAAALYAAFKNGAPALPVIQQFARLTDGGR